MPDKPSTDKVSWRLTGDSPLPLYRRIEALVVGHIQAGRLKPGDLLPSYPALAKSLGVADRTVRQAYASLQRSGVLLIRRGTGTFVAGGPGQAGTGREAGVLGVWRPSLPVAVSVEPFCWRALRGIHEAAAEARCDLLFFAEGLDRASVPRPLDGLLALLPSADTVARLKAAPFPAVLIGPNAEGGPVDSVGFDFEGAASDLAYRLIGLGHRRIGLARLLNAPGAADVEAGYRHAMGAAALPVQPAWVADVDVDLGELGLSAADALLGEQVTAVLASGEGLARMVAEEALRRGVAIPEELSIAALTTSRPDILPGGVALEALLLDPLELGARAVRRLAEARAARGGQPLREVLEAVRLEGKSVAPPPT